ncbi:MAG: hypothetical protein JXD21_00275 [Candidatus Omnitrophica bacterium]|nr:hypothetical protein [Candidatus Omnitrophota bacterium]
MLLICIIPFSIIVGAESQTQSVKGKVEGIDFPEHTLIVDGQRFFITPELIQYAYLEVGDMVELIVENTENGQEVVDYFYIFDEDMAQDTEMETEPFTMPGLEELEEPGGREEPEESDEIEDFNGRFKP